MSSVNNRIYKRCNLLHVTSQIAVYAGTRTSAFAELHWYRINSLKIVNIAATSSWNLIWSPSITGALARINSEFKFRLDAREISRLHDFEVTKCELEILFYYPKFLGRCSGKVLV